LLTYGKKEKEIQFLKEKLKNVLEYKNKEKKYDFTNEDFKNALSIISILNYNFHDSLEKNPINLFFKELIELITKLEDLDNLERQNINWEFLKRFIINEVYFFLTSKDLFTNKHRDFNIVKETKTLKINSKREYLNFFLEESNLITNYQKCNLIIGKDFITYEDFKNNIVNKENNNLEDYYDCKIIIDEDIFENSMCFKVISDYAGLDKRGISLADKKNIIENIIENLSFLNFNFINIENLLKLEENIIKTFLKKQKYIDLDKLYCSDKKKYVFKNKICPSILNFLFENEAKNIKILESFLLLNISLREKRKISLNNNKCIASFTCSLDYENYTIKIYSEKIIVFLINFNVLNEDIVKNFNLKVKNTISVLNMDIKFKIDRIKIGDDEIKFLSSELSDDHVKRIRLYNESVEKTDIKLTYKIKK